MRNCSAMSIFAMGMSSEIRMTPSSVVKYAQPIVDFSRMSMAIMTSFKTDSGLLWSLISWPLATEAGGPELRTLEDGVSTCELFPGRGERKDWLGDSVRR